MTFPRFALAAGLLAVAVAAGAQTAPRKTYIVQMADAPAATYSGNISGLAATRPAPGAKLSANAPSVRAYVRHLDIQRSSVLARVPATTVLHRYNLTFNGFAAQLTEAEAMTLKGSGLVVSITESEVRKLDTTRTPEFLGLSAPGGLWSKLDAASRKVKGEDVIIGVVDSGVWPENASFGDKVDVNGKPVAYNQAGTLDYGAPPARWLGICQAGEGFNATMCNNKLIGARYYVAAFNSSGAIRIPLEYASPRDGGGHGTHTASTAGGNSGVDAVVNGSPAGVMSGIAPRARLATYKVCWEATVSAATGCYTADMLKAIDDAVADGVDVINFSISGTKTNFLDPVEIAYFNAAAANVFVAASAGNSGPGNEVAHMSPWLTTVAASTHDRQALAELTLGDGSKFIGVSVFGGTLSNLPMVLASTIPAPGALPADALRCFTGSLSATAAVGKMVVCDRGVIARVDKSAEVKRVGGLAMVLTNASPAADSLAADFHSVPSVHLPLANRAAVHAYAQTPSPTGSISPPANPPAVVAPVMAGFSSRGPNKANANILKPDITGPGVDVIAGYIARLTQAEHDAVLLGTFTPPPNANSLSGTSMSSPHVAGAAALLKQLYPTWSPSAIKSAMMTSTNDVKLASGAPDLDRFGYGAGHMNPNGSANPGLVYDASPADYGRFLCGLGLAPPAGTGTCAFLGSIKPWNLNLASLTAAEVAGTLTLTRKVKNVTGATGTYVASTSLPGWNVVVTPASLTLAPGATSSFTVALTRTSATVGAWTFGNLTWTDGVRQVRSPLSARAIGFVAPAQVTDTRVSGKGTKVFTVVSAYTGSLSVVATGLVPATRSAGEVGQGATQCFDFSVAADAQVARFQLFNADTLGGSATDLDLEVFNGPGGTGTSVGASGGSTSDEVVTLRAPAAGGYSACVTGFGTPQTGATYTMSSWVVGPAVGVQTLKASGPSSVYAGGTASIGLGWSVPAGKRYLGNVQFIDNASAVIGSTLVVVDNH